jgi:lipopolysaccharide export system protein LptA
LKKIFIFTFLIITAFGYSQGKRIKILNAKISSADEEKFPGAIILSGAVKIEHEGAILDCNRAIVYKERNFFKAIGNVRINQGDTIIQTSDFANYDGNLKRSKSWGNVVLRDPSMTLTTDTLNFDRLNQKLFYKDFATITDASSVLKSKNGNFFLETKKFTATSSVTVTNPENLIESNHLDYYTNSGHAYLYGPSTVTSKKEGNKIYCEKGFYNTKTDISHFVKNAKLFLKDRTIQGDSLYYDKPKGFASATNNIKVIDTVQNFVAKGNYAELFEEKDSLFIVKRAVAISVIDKDSMYVHGDTLLVTGKQKERIIRTYNNVKIFKNDLQGKCDSLHTNEASGITKMYYAPVLWSEKNQITGDSILLLSNKITEQLDSLKVLGNSFIIQKDSIDPNNFNQIKGKNMYGKFIENKLRTLLVKGNGEAVNYNRNEQGALETITKQYCSNIEFEIENNEMSAIKCLKQSDGKTYPPSQFPEEDKKIRGFIWREDEQPKVMEDIFVKGKIIPRKKLIKPTKLLKVKDLLGKDGNKKDLNKDKIIKD